MVLVVAGVREGRVDFIVLNGWMRYGFRGRKVRLTLVPKLFKVLVDDLLHSSRFL